MYVAPPLEIDNAWKANKDSSIVVEPFVVLDWKVGEDAIDRTATLYAIINATQRKAPCGAIPDRIEVSKLQGAYIATVWSTTNQMLSRAISTDQEWALRELLSSVES